MLRRRFNQNAIGEYMTLVASEGDTEFTVEKEILVNIQRFYYSIDGGKWTKVNFDIDNKARFNVAYGSDIRFKSDTFISQNEKKICFTSNMPFSITGNIMSLGYFDDAKGKTSIGDNKYACLFESSLVRHVDTNFLPATTLTGNCYENMFAGCTNLTTAPELPATTLASNCYKSMFHGCNNLTTAPELPATTLASNCYKSMFHGCNNLTTAPELHATTLANGCYENMFQGCTSLTTASELPATTLADSCYRNMFYSCTSLATAPELLATTLVYNCYRYMFYGCKKINYIKMLATDISASYCLTSWVAGVSSTGTFVKNKNATWNVTGTSGIPSGWIIQKV